MSWFLNCIYSQIFWEAVVLECGPLSLVSTIEELLGRSSGCFRLVTTKLTSCYWGRQHNAIQYRLQGPFHFVSWDSFSRTKTAEGEADQSPVLLGWNSWDIRDKTTGYTSLWVDWGRGYPTQGMDVCVRVYYVCVVLCVSRGLTTG
jgi:hypothetical protein